MKTQKEQVIEVMRQNGGYATFGQLNHLVDFSTWTTKTPQATVRRILFNKFVPVMVSFDKLQKSRKDGNE